MNVLTDVYTYMRRILKTPSNSVLTDDILIDYINRFVLNDIQARIQLFDFKTTYSFQTQPGVDQYNMPLYNLQIENANVPQNINSYPVYQGFLGPAFINGIPVQFETEKDVFFGGFPNVVQYAAAIAVGNGGSAYTVTFPVAPTNSNPITTPVNAILRGHIDISGIIATGANVDPPFYSALNTGVIPSTSIQPQVYFTAQDVYGNNMVVSDSGQFLKIGGATMPNYGLLLAQGNSTTGFNQFSAPFGYSALPGGYSNNFTITGITQATQAVVTVNNTLIAGESVLISGVSGMTQLNGNTYQIVTATPTSLTLNVNSTAFTAYVSGGIVSSLQNVINYFTGVANVTFPNPVAANTNINAQCYFFQTGLPRSILYYNNTLVLRVPPARQYLVELEAYLSPSAFLTSNAALPFGYMAEYIGRGAARKILSDTGDVEQFQFYEPFFKEQEMLVWKRSQRQWTSTRTQTIYNQGSNQNNVGNFWNQGINGF